ncbi:ribosome hibernation-promoting factor, HPF/YfiA family [Clostridium taeniosporum]|uniref:Ribosome hibernation promoting factor n=1 Tax=Clostridium taeniosporum TaxID=394958 RepID=A0A1D7XHK3_9CLOT|nr:ribosome-associated translation inhibitor RaiA [Clostridium taeniosporum]AOR22620.1 ribosomal subunit interface protein [Clostridium taeniosporum]
MKVTVIAKNIELTNALREMVEKKVSKLGKYFNSDIEAKATLSVQRNRQIVEVMIPFNGVVLRGEEANEDMYKAIDLVEEKLERQIRKQKTKLSRRKNGSMKFGEMFNLPSVEEDDEESKLVKRKRFGVKPMDVDEAILQMELVGHNFFVYQDADSNKINVVYKRKDGDYGLLDPEYK